MIISFGCSVLSLKTHLDSLKQILLTVMFSGYFDRRLRGTFLISAPSYLNHLTLMRSMFMCRCSCVDVLGVYLCFVTRCMPFKRRLKLIEEQGWR